mgnify:CR=1 FL=1
MYVVVFAIVTEAVYEKRSGYINTVTNVSFFGLDIFVLLYSHCKEISFMLLQSLYYDYDGEL